MSKRGAKGKYSKEIHDKIIELIRAGNYAVTASGAVGICEDTYYRWIKEKPDFSEDIKKAKSECIARNVMTIQKASQKTWQAAAWWLERTNFELFGRKDNVDITTKGEKLPINIIINPIKSDNEE